MLLSPGQPFLLLTDQTNIFLCGFMGSGKTTLGKKLAGVLNLPFFDLDDLIEKKTAKPITDIFETEGESFFRKTESECLIELINAPGKKVVSLGGGTVCFNDNLKSIKESGTLVYIDMPVKTLAQRIAQNMEHRPLVKNKTPDELLSFIKSALEKRKEHYQQAHITVNGLNLTAQLLQQKLIEFR